MHCPYCSVAVDETTEECPSCQFSVTKLEAVLGAIPQFSPVLSDKGKLFSTGDHRKLLSHLDKFGRHFPQSTFHIITAPVAKNISLKLYALWVFNKSGICKELDKGGRNRDILLLIDSENSRAYLMFGYGLEPFVSGDEVNALLQEGAASFKGNDHSNGAIQVIQATESKLVEVVNKLPQAFGIPPESKA